MGMDNELIGSAPKGSRFLWIPLFRFFVSWYHRIILVLGSLDGLKWNGNGRPQERDEWNDFTLSSIQYGHQWLGLFGWKLCHILISDLVFFQFRM